MPNNDRLERRVVMSKSAWSLVDDIAGMREKVKRNRYQKAAARNAIIEEAIKQYHLKVNDEKKNNESKKEQLFPLIILSNIVKLKYTLYSFMAKAMGSDEAVIVAYDAAKKGKAEWSNLKSMIAEIDDAFSAEDLKMHDGFFTPDGSLVAAAKKAGQRLKDSEEKKTKPA